MEKGNEHPIEELRNEDKEQKEVCSDSSAEDEGESETEEEIDAPLYENETENSSTIVWTHARYAFVDEGRKSTDVVSRGDDKRVCIKEEVPEVSTSISYMEKRTIRKAVAFSKQLAKADPFENITRNTPKAP